MIYKVPLLVVVGLFSAIVGTWVADRTPPSTLISRTPVNPTVAPGDELKIRFVINRVRQCETRVDRQVVDSTGKRVVLDPLSIINVPSEMGTQEYTSPVPVPVLFANGPAQYQYASTWVCNPFHRWFPIHGSPQTVHFSVVGQFPDIQRVLPVP